MTTASLGSTDSLVSPVKLFLGTRLSAEEQARAQIKESTVRFAVGIEHVDDLIADIDQALRKTVRLTSYALTRSARYGVADEGMDTAPFLLIAIFRNISVVSGCA